MPASNDNSNPVIRFRTAVSQITNTLRKRGYFSRHVDGEKPTIDLDPKPKNAAEVVVAAASTRRIRIAHQIEQLEAQLEQVDPHRPHPTENR